MGNNAILIDPAVLVWDTTDFPRREYIYWDAVAEVLRIFEIIDDFNFQTVMSGRLAELLLDAFPITEIGSQRSELRDFSRRVYSFISQALATGGCFSGLKAKKITPDFISRVQFSDDLKSEIECAFYDAASKSIDAVFSHSVAIECSDGLVEIESDDTISAIPCLTTGSCYDDFIFSKTKKYEKHQKHDRTYGYGSKLPACLGNEDMQELLESAMHVDGADYLCVFSKKAEAFLVFRPHHKNRYHGYPEEADVLTKRGIVVGNIPRV